MSIFLRIQGSLVKILLRVGLDAVSVPQAASDGDVRSPPLLYSHPYMLSCHPSLHAPSLHNTSPSFHQCSNMLPFVSPITSTLT